jgi:hypothetical protein
MEANPQINPKLSKLRDRMTTLGLDAYVVFHNDAHNV